MKEAECPLHGRCPFVRECLDELKGKVPMKLFNILISILVIIFGAVLALGWTIKTDVALNNKISAVHAEKMRNFERILNGKFGK